MAAAAHTAIIKTATTATTAITKMENSYFPRAVLACGHWAHGNFIDMPEPHAPGSSGFQLSNCPQLLTLDRGLDCITCRSCCSWCWWRLLLLGQVNCNFSRRSSSIELHLAQERRPKKYAAKHFVICVERKFKFNCFYFLCFVFGRYVWMPILCCNIYF